MKNKTGILESALSLLSDQQKDVVIRQWHKHQHKDILVDYDVSGNGDFLREFLVGKGVWDPFAASGRYHARYLFYHSSDYVNKRVLDMGCGTGLMGIVMAKFGSYGGAAHVTMSDISKYAVVNSWQNTKTYGLLGKVDVVQSDLFENIKGEFDIIDWMIPFFPTNTSSLDNISRSMLMEPNLLERFLEQSKEHLSSSGKIILPSFELGGDLTHPAKYANRYGFDCKTTWEFKSTNGIQQGMLYMHELTPKVK